MLLISTYDSFAYDSMIWNNCVLRDRTAINIFICIQLAVIIKETDGLMYVRDPHFVITVSTDVLAPDRHEQVQ